MECLNMIPIHSKVRTKGYDGEPYSFTKVWRGRYRNGLAELPKPQPFLVPCGKCAFCLTNRRSSWMFRIYHEMRTQVHRGYFLTFTYDERHVPRAAQTGRLSLRFRDVQLYLKRLRKEKYYAKYICVGEYGSDTHRPHYHMLLWTDSPVEFLQSNWKSSKDGSVMGSVHFGMLSMASAMYTLKYIIQPKVVEQDDIEPTRAQFSKGIGLGYLSEQVYNYHTMFEEHPVFTSRIGGVELPLPRYYRNKIFTKHQLNEHRLEVLDDLIDLKARVFADAVAQGAYALDGMSIAERYRSARRYLRHLRVEENARIIKTTKFNQSL